MSLLLNFGIQHNSLLDPWIDLSSEQMNIMNYYSPMEDDMWWYRSIIIIMFQWWNYIWQVWGVFIGTWLGWVVLFELGTNGGSELGFWYGRLRGTILVALYGIPIGKFDGTLIGYLEGLIDGDVVGKCLCFCCCSGYVHI